MLPWLLMQGSSTPGQVATADVICVVQADDISVRIGADDTVILVPADDMSVRP